MESQTRMETEFFEEEVCQRLIQMSFAKIVNSKNERGGAKLHKNLLILHLLQKARSEQRSGSSSPTEESPDDFEEEPGSKLEEEEEDSVEAVEESVEEEPEDEVTPLSMVEPAAPPSASRPPLLRFLTPVDEEEREIPEGEIREVDDPAEGVVGPSPVAESPRVLVLSNDDYYATPPLTHPYSNNPEEGEEEARSKTRKTTSTDSGCDSGSGSSSDEEEEEGEEEGDSDDSLTSPPAASEEERSPRRKRKFSLNAPERDGRKRTCVEPEESAQISGLISVFHTGLAGVGPQQPDEQQVESKNSGRCADEQNLPRSISCPSLLPLTSCKSC